MESSSCVLLFGTIFRRLHRCLPSPSSSFRLLGVDAAIRREYLFQSRLGSVSPIAVHHGKHGRVAVAPLFRGAWEVGTDGEVWARKGGKLSSERTRRADLFFRGVMAFSSKQAAFVVLYRRSIACTQTSKMLRLTTARSAPQRTGPATWSLRTVEFEDKQQSRRKNAHLDDHVLPKDALQVEARGREVYSCVRVPGVHSSLHPTVAQPEEVAEQQIVDVLQGTSLPERRVEPDVACGERTPTTPNRRSCLFFSMVLSSRAYSRNKINHEETTRFAAGRAAEPRISRRCTSAKGPLRGRYRPRLRSSSRLPPNRFCYKLYIISAQQRFHSINTE